jgi:hypothetical protein
MSKSKITFTFPKTLFFFLFFLIMVVTVYVISSLRQEFIQHDCLIEGLGQLHGRYSGISDVRSLNQEQQRFLENTIHTCIRQKG